jgi:hypothetical protein
MEKRKWEVNWGIHPHGDRKSPEPIENKRVEWAPLRERVRKRHEIKELNEVNEIKEFFSRASLRRASSGHFEGQYE